MGQKIRGVNLGGWLLLEKWMTPSLFHGMKATDETTWCVELGDQAQTTLHNHWNTFITEDDFAWLSERGINAVRIPVGYWIFGAPYPYHQKFGNNSEPFVTGGLKILDKAFEWAEKYEILVQIDLHAAPGCQNGFDNGGLHEVCDWHTRDEFINFTLETLEKLAERYHSRPALHSIHTLNEPRWDIPTPLLKDFTQQAYHRIRRHCHSNEVAVVFHDGFRDWREYCDFMRPPEYENVILDIHRYQCFSEEDVKTDIFGHIQTAAIDRKNEADAINTELGLWSIVGEWSLGLRRQEVDLWSDPNSPTPIDLEDNLLVNAAHQAYGASQLLSFERHKGWFFWSYKTETTPAWCFRECVERGWLPKQFS